MSVSAARDEQFLHEVAGALAEAQLEAVVVGTAAAIVQGVRLVAQDLDLLVRSAPDARAKVDRFAARLRLSVAEAGERVLSLTGGVAPIDVDVLLDPLPGGLYFADVATRADRFTLGGHELRVATLADVIASKQAMDRNKDRVQLPLLRNTLQVQSVATARAARLRR
jgi:hypothetical protein